MLAKSDIGRAKPMSPTFTVGRAPPAFDSPYFSSIQEPDENRRVEKSIRRLDIPVKDILLMKIVEGRSDVIPHSKMLRRLEAMAHSEAFGLLAQYPKALLAGELCPVPIVQSIAIRYIIIYIII